MVFALCLYDDNRIHSAWKVLPNGNYDGMPIADTLPDGNLPDYLYVEGQYIHDPLPKPAPVEPEPTTDEILNALLGV